MIRYVVQRLRPFYDSMRRARNFRSCEGSSFRYTHSGVEGKVHDLYKGKPRVPKLGWLGGSKKKIVLSLRKNRMCWNASNTQIIAMNPCFLIKLSHLFLICWIVSAFAYDSLFLQYPGLFSLTLDLYSGENEYLGRDYKRSFMLTENLNLELWQYYPSPLWTMFTEPFAIPSSFPVPMVKRIKTLSENPLIHNNQYLIILHYQNCNFKLILSLLTIGISQWIPKDSI